MLSGGYNLYCVIFPFVKVLKYDGRPYMATRCIYVFSIVSMEKLK